MKLTTRRARQLARMRKTHGAGNSRGKGGRPPSRDRCPCGAMTRTRAAKRQHVC